MNITIAKRAMDFAQWNNPPISEDEIRQCFDHRHPLPMHAQTKKIHCFTATTAVGRRLSVAYTASDSGFVVIQAREAPAERDAVRDLIEWEKNFTSSSDSDF